MSQTFSPDPVPVTYFNMEMSLGETGAGGIFTYLQLFFP